VEFLQQTGCDPMWFFRNKIIRNHSKYWKIGAKKNVWRNRKLYHLLNLKQINNIKLVKIIAIISKIQKYLKWKVKWKNIKVKIKLKFQCKFLSGQTKNQNYKKKIFSFANFSFVNLCILIIS